MRIGRRVAKTLLWGFVLLSSTLGGGLWFAYWYITDSETAANLIREQAIRFFPRAMLDPGRVRVHLFAGEVAVHDLKLRQEINGAWFETVRIPWLNIRIKRGKLAQGDLGASEIIVGRPTLRLCRRRDGTWNLQGLLADPWPGPWIDTPPIVISNATLELFVEEEAASNSAPRSSSLAPVAPAIPSAGSGQAAEPAQPAPDLPLRSTPPAKAKGTIGPGLAILRDVSLRIERVAGAGPSQYAFEGSARGDVFGRLTLRGTIDLSTGITTLDGTLDGLTLSESLRRRIPRELRPAAQALALNNGVIDVELNRLRYNPGARPVDRLKYQASVKIREGVWDCPLLPFTVNDLEASLTVEDGVVSIDHAQGSNGKTTLRASGKVDVTNPERFPLDLSIKLLDLELDKRLRDRTPSEYDNLWDIFAPRGVSMPRFIWHARLGARRWSGMRRCCAGTFRQSTAIFPIRSIT